MSARHAMAEQLADASIGTFTSTGVGPTGSSLRRANIIYYASYGEGTASSSPRRSSQNEFEVAAEDVRTVLVAYKGKISAHAFSRLRDRLAVLLSADERDTEDEPPDVESFRLMMQFLSDHPELRHPSVFLNRSGLFTASWRPEKRKLSSLIFHPRGEVNWLVFTPRPDDEIETDEAAGRVLARSVLEVLRRHDALDWMKQPRDA